MPLLSCMVPNCHCCFWCQWPRNNNGTKALHALITFALSRNLQCHPSAAHSHFTPFTQQNFGLLRNLFPLIFSIRHLKYPSIHTVLVHSRHVTTFNKSFKTSFQPYDTRPFSSRDHTISVLSDQLWALSILTFRYTPSFLTLSIHDTPTKLLKHFSSRTFTFLLSALLIPHVSALCNAVRTFTLSYWHFFAFTSNLLLLSTHWGETDSAIRCRKRTGVTSPRGSEEAGC